MRVAYLLAIFPSITESFALQEIKALQRFGVDVDVLAAGKDPRIEIDNNISIHYRPARASRDSLLGVIRMVLSRPLRFMRLFGFAIKLLFISPAESLSFLANIHTICDFVLYLEANNVRHLHAYFLSWPSLIAVGVKIMSGITISISAHSRDIYVEAGDINRKIQEAEFVSACTRTGIDSIKSQVSQSLHHKLNLSYHGLNFDDIRSCETTASNFEIVAVGRLVSKKGYFVLLEAFAAIYRVHPDITLKIIGSGMLYTKIEQYLKAHQLEESVSLMGWQDNDCVLDTMGRANLLVVSSIKSDDGDMDGIPNVILEAFSMMTPVIASDIKSIREIIDHGVNGLLFEIGNADDLAEKIELLYNSGDLRSRISLGAKKTLAKDFDIDKNVLNKIKLFEQFQ